MTNQVFFLTRLVLARRNNGARNASRREDHGKLQFACRFSAVLSLLGSVTCCARTVLTDLSALNSQRSVVLPAKSAWWLRSSSGVISGRSPTRNYPRIRGGSSCAVHAIPDSVLSSPRSRECQWPPGVTPSLILLQSGSVRPCSLGSVQPSPIPRRRPRDRCAVLLPR